LYLWYKLKSIPRKLIVKFVKSKEETPKGTEIVNNLPNQINIEENVNVLIEPTKAKVNSCITKNQCPQVIQLDNK